MVTPLGRTPQKVLARVLANETAAAKPLFETSRFDCPVYAAVQDFNAYDYYPDNKSLRFMSRDAQLAVVAAGLAMEDADLRAGQPYSPHDIALYGSTGIAGLTAEEITRIIRFSADEDGSLNLHDFGKIALKRVRPALSFKILANMPICFVSIFQRIRGPNAIYTPWEGNGAQAIAAGIQAIRRGDVPCALVGGCDVKTRELSFISLQQLGVFESWKQSGRGCVPAEGAVFLVLEDESAATKRGRKPYARVLGYRQRSLRDSSELAPTVLRILSELTADYRPTRIFASGDGNPVISEAENEVLRQAGCENVDLIRPKCCIGNLFAAAAAAQFALAAVSVGSQADGQPALANCFGYGTEQASFMLG